MPQNRLEKTGDGLQAAGKQMMSCGGSLVAVGCSGFLLIVIVLVVLALLSSSSSSSGHLEKQQVHVKKAEVQNKTIHEGLKIKAATKASTIKEAALRDCRSNISVNAHASCPFAENILNAYEMKPSINEDGITTLSVESPVTHKNYEVSCVAGHSQFITCRTTNAEVVLSDLTVKSVREGGASGAPVSSGPSGLYGGQSRAENEEAGCKYGFTVSEEGGRQEIKCNSQEEGRRIQEDNRHESEDPQREAENQAITEEDRSREECDVQVGVGAC
jgi:hypothetical protein